MFFPLTYFSSENFSKEMLEAVTKSSKGIGHWIKIHLYVKSQILRELHFLCICITFFFFYQCFIAGLFYLDGKKLSVLTDLAEAYIYDR